MANTKIKKAGDYSVSSFLGYASHNGNATKKSTVQGGGNYPVNFHLQNGASAVTAGCFVVAAGLKKSNSVPAEKMNDALSKCTDPSTVEGKVVDKLIKIYQKETGKSFGNTKTLVNRLKGSISKGAILSFIVGDGQEMDNVLSLAKAVK